MDDKKENLDTKNLLNFISEAGMLKRVPRSGWSVLGIKDAESVADHCFRCAVIGYILASMENVAPYKILLMTLFNDIHEARITDLHKMAQRYINITEGEKKSFEDQIELLPESINKELSEVRQDYDIQGSQESRIARDADILECLLQAKDYSEHGYPEAVKFMEKAPDFLITNSAKRLWKTAKNMNLNDWWVHLTQFTR
ncbi:MAG: HD domain-containing protein [Candidatus Omnitrophica bacterium]|nr:HD domain-containing protein [Candidatus Omnitrophota bacterium]